MKSRPASSASRANARHSGQVAAQRSGTLVAERPDEQLAPNRPILSALPLYMAMRFFMDATGASTAFSVVETCAANITALVRGSSFRGAGSASPESIVTDREGPGSAEPLL